MLLFLDFLGFFLIQLPFFLPQIGWCTFIIKMETIEKATKKARNNPKPFLEIGMLIFDEHQFNTFLYMGICR